MSNDVRCQRINGVPGVLLQAGTGQNELMSWLARRQYLTEELAGQGRFAQATETLQYEQSADRCAANRRTSCCSGR